MLEIDIAELPTRGVVAEAVEEVGTDLSITICICVEKFFGITSGSIGGGLLVIL